MTPEGGLWQAVAGTAPADQTVKPLLKTSTESGEWNGYTFTISSQPGRVDFILSSTLNGTDLPNIGTYQASINAFKALGMPNGLPSVIRAAFGAVALAPCASHKECYDGLGAIIQHVRISPDSREFLYRINNPLKSTVCVDIKLNCISTWGAIKVVFVTMADSKTTEEIKYAIRAELDFSTDAESNLLPDAKIDELLEELSKLGENILDVGPTP